MDRDALAEFLVNRRHKLLPADVGLSVGTRRRTAGLRREEVALLATMSTDYYARLEQRRGPQPSTQMLASLARALRLSRDERDYLFRVAGHSAPERQAAAEHIAPGLLRVLDRLQDTPAQIISALGEVLVQNEPAKALLGDASGRTGWDRSEIYRWFVYPQTERLRYPAADHARQGRAQVASLRAALGAAGPTSRAAQLVRELSARSDEFIGIWEAHEVSRRFEDHKVIVHPELGEVEVDCQALITEDAAQVLLVLTAEPHSEAAGKLELLPVLGRQDLSPGR